MSKKQKLTTRAKHFFGSGEWSDMTVLYGNRRAVIRGCRKILAYAPNEICLSQGKRVVCLRGRQLFCVSFSAGGVTVEGKIDAVLLRLQEVSK